MATATQPVAAADEKGARRIIVSEDLPLTVLTAVATTLVMNALGLPRNLLYVGVALSPLVADVIKNAFHGLRKRWLSLLAALLVLLGTAGRALAARLRARQDRAVGAPAVVATAVLSAAITIGLFTVSELGSGNAMTFFGSPPSKDLAAPRLTVPAGIVVRAPGPTVVRYRVSARDRVDGHVTASCAPRSGAVFAVGTTTVHCSAADAQGNRTTGVFHVTVQHVAGHVVLTLPEPISVEAAGPSGARALYRVSAVDVHGKHLSASCTPASGSVFPIGKTSVTCSAVDASGRRTTGRFQVVVRDNTAPTLSLPGDQSVKTAAGSGRTFVYAATASDRVDGSVRPRCTPSSGSRFPVGTTTVACIATDAHGNRATGSFAVNVKLSKQLDTAPPSLVLPNEISREATSPAGAAVTYSASARDGVDGSVEASCLPASGSTFPLGSTRVRCSAHDAAGNLATRTFAVTVVDTTAPVLAPLAAVTAEATSPSGATADYKPAATDLVDGDVAPVCTPAPGSTFALGVTQVSCTATDRHGNATSGGFSVTVADTTPPAIKVPGELTAEATSRKGAAVSYVASATDLVDGAVTPACSPPPRTFPLGQTTVTCTATDALGNRSTAGFTVSVVDRTAPRISLPAGFTVEAVYSGAHLQWGATITYTATAIDTVDGRVTPSCSIPSGTWVAAGATTAKTIQCTAVDSRGNKSTGSFTVTIHVTVIA